MKNLSIKDILDLVRFEISNRFEINEFFIRNLTSKLGKKAQFESVLSKKSERTALRLLEKLEEESSDFEELFTYLITEGIKSKKALSEFQKSIEKKVDLDSLDEENLTVLQGYSSLMEAIKHLLFFFFSVYFNTLENGKPDFNYEAFDEASETFKSQIDKANSRVVKDFSVLKSLSKDKIFNSVEEEVKMLLEFSSQSVSPLLIKFAINRFLQQLFREDILSFEYSEENFVQQILSCIESFVKLLDYHNICWDLREVSFNKKLQSKEVLNLATDNFFLVNESDLQNAKEQNKIIL